MSYVKEVLHKYLPSEYIELVALEERQDDARWMIRKGYKTDFHLDDRGFMRGGELTRSGKKFLDECNKKFHALFKKIENMPPDAEEKAKSLLLEYIKRHRDTDYRIGLSDAEKRVCDRLTRYFLGE